MHTSFTGPPYFPGKRSTLAHWNIKKPRGLRNVVTNACECPVLMKTRKQNRKRDIFVSSKTWGVDVGGEYAARLCDGEVAL